MTSRFVSGGTIAGDDGIEPPASSSTAPKPLPLPPPQQSAQWNKEAPKKNPEWEAVQRELDAERRRREEARKSAVEGSGEKSLYDILQANKGTQHLSLPSHQSDRITP